jgi:hypothetical protein
MQELSGQEALGAWEQDIWNTPTIKTFLKLQFGNQ